MDFSITPIYRLAHEVFAGRMTLAEAQQQLAQPGMLDSLNNVTVQDIDDVIKAKLKPDLAAAERERLITYAVLNCTAARHKGSNAVWGNCNSTLAFLRWGRGELKLALYHYQQALEAFAGEPGAEEILHRIRLDIGKIHQESGDYHAALRVYRRAFTLAWEATNLEHQETACERLGLAFHFLGSLSQAAAVLEQAVALSRQRGDEINEGIHLDNLGAVQIDQGRLAKAEKNLKRSMQLALQWQDQNALSQRLGNLGNLYQVWAQREKETELTKRYLEQALAHHQEALDIGRRQGDAQGRCQQLANLGQDYALLGQYDTAADYLEQAWRCSLKVADAGNIQWRIRFAQGELARGQKHHETAYQNFLQAIDLVEEQRSSLTDVESRLNFWQEKALLYKTMVLACLELRQPQLEQALRFTELSKARYLADHLDGDRSPEIDTLEMIWGAVAALPLQTAVILFNITREGTLVFIVTAHAQHRTAANGWILSADGRIRARLLTDFKQSDLEQLLVQLNEKGEVSGGFLDEHRALRFEPDILEEVSTNQLEQPLLRPVWRQLDDDIDKLCLMPNLGLSILPLHAGRLPSSNGENRYLIDQYQVSYAPSFRLLRHSQQQALHRELDAAPDFFAIANPADNLDWAEVEVQHIVGDASLGHVRKLGKETDGAQMRQAILEESPLYDYVHFACHASFDLVQPHSSALSLSPLPGESEPHNLDLATILRQSTSPEGRRTRLVVLSACETGMVDPGDLADESIGFPAAFLLAGVPGVISTLWQVNDASTALLMICFYQNHFREGLPLAQALQKAQRWLCKASASQLTEILPAVKELQVVKDNPNRPPFAKPYYWAGFIFTGVDA